MLRNCVRSVVAVLVGSMLGALAVPGCVVKIGKGSGPEGTGGTGGATTEGTGEGGEDQAGGASPADDDAAALAAYENADPDEVALRSAAAAYAASVTASLVAAQIPDPETADPETVQALIEQHAPAGWDAAEQWLSTIDVSTLSLKGIFPKPECTIEPYDCPWNTQCPYEGKTSYCIVTHCGDCPWCSFPQNLVFKTACAYGCMLSDGTVVGGAWILRTVFNNYTKPDCFLF